MEMKNCSLCYNETEFWGVSACGHGICLLCSARLRILCKQKECPQCRESQEEVIITRNLKPYSSLLGFELDRDEHGFVFSDESSRAALSDILAISCPFCKVRPPSMKLLQDHVRRTHERQYCDLCVKELKLFPFEHKVYTRQLLTEHRRDGDRDDKSHKGHPLCKFCNERYLDKDALFFHLKEKHFWCHFCEADGKQEYYESYSFLRKHYRKSHFLCEEGQCRYEKYTAVFRSSLDFQAHKAKVHTRGLSKAEAKQLRQVDVGFSYARETPAPSYQQSRGRMASQASYRQREAQEIEMAKALSLSESTGTINSSSKEKKGKSRTGRKSPVSTNCSDGIVAAPNPRPDSCPTPHATVVSKIPPVDCRKEPSHEEKRSVQVKPPPGLDGVVVVEPREQEAWPLLDSVPAKKGPTPGPPPGFHDVIPKPSYHSLSSCPMQSSWSAISQTLRPPPGLVVAGEFGTMPNSTNVGVCDKNSNSTSLFLSNSNVIKVAEGILNNDPDKVSRFRSLSGKYQSGAVSVDEYHSECERLFGSAWRELGPRLAATIPDKRKQERLLKKLGRAFVVEEPLPWNSGHSTAAAAVNKYMMEDRNQTAWLCRGRRNYLAALNEEEYPSLGSKVGVPTHSATPTWSCKVSVK